MKAVLYLIGAVVLGNIVWATFFYAAPKPTTAQPIVNSATQKGLDPWMANEHHMVTGRAGQRKSALEALGQPWSSFCTPDGRKQLVAGLDYYWYFRSSQIKGYPKTWGENARPYIVKAWATADDSRIERLTREAYANGYLNPGGFQILHARSDGRDIARRARAWCALRKLGGASAIEASVTSRA